MCSKSIQSLRLSLWLSCRKWLETISAYDQSKGFRGQRPLTEKCLAFAVVMKMDTHFGLLS